MNPAEELVSVAQLRQVVSESDATEGTKQTVLSFLEDEVIQGAQSVLRDRIVIGLGMVTWKVRGDLSGHQNIISAVCDRKRVRIINS